MRNRLLTVLSALLILGLLLPQGVMARRHTLLGSISLTKAGGAPLTNEVTGVATISNPGFEKNISEPIPPYTLPVFIDQDENDGADSSSRVTNKHMDTLVILTNTTGASLAVVLTLRDAEGVILNTITVTLPAHGTKAIALSDLIG